MQFLRTETTPIVRALAYFSFGHAETTTAEYNLVYGEFKENIKVINNFLKQKKFMVGDSLSVCDIYLVLSQVEMQQCLMDTNLKNSLNFFNAVFKSVIELPAFKKRMGSIRVGKKQIMPSFSDAASSGDSKAAEKAQKAAKKEKANHKK